MKTSRNLAGNITREVAGGVFWAIPLGIIVTRAEVYLSNERSEILFFEPASISVILLLIGVSYAVFTELVHDNAASFSARFRHRLAIPVALSFVASIHMLGGLRPGSDWIINDGLYAFLPFYNLIVMLMAMIYADSKFFRERVQVYFLLYLIVSVCALVVDLIWPTTFSVVYGRSSGFAENPNAAGIIILLLSVFTVSWERSRWQDILIWILAGFGMFLTLSRSGIITYFILILLHWIIINKMDGSTWRQRLAMSPIPILLCVVTIGVIFVYSNETLSIENNTRIRQLHALLSFDFREGIGTERTDLVDKFILIIGDAPILGHGTGYYGRFLQGPHNTYIMLWLETGIFGLLVYLLFLTVGVYYFYRQRDPRGIVFMIMLVLFGFFSHRMVLKREIFVLLGVAIVFADAVRYKTMESQFTLRYKDV